MGVCKCSLFCCTLLYVPSSFCNHLDGEERDACFAWFVFLVSRGCCVALPRGAMVCLQFVIVVFTEYTHLLFLLGLSKPVKGKTKSGRAH